MFRELIPLVRSAETMSRTGKIENIVGMSIEASGGRAAIGDIASTPTSPEVRSPPRWWGSRTITSC